MNQLEPAMLALASVGLSETRHLPRRGWDRRFERVVANGLAGLLADAHERDLVDLDEQLIAQLRSRLDAEAYRCVQLEGELIRLEPILADLGAVVLKGAVLAHGAYPDPSLRPFTDLDLLVTGDRHQDAVRALESIGYERSRPEPIRGYDATLGKALTLVHPGGVVIDLHRTLVAGLPGASIDVEEIVENRIEVVVNDRTVPAPSWAAHLIEACVHAVIGDGFSRAIAVRDIGQVALHPGLEPECVVELAERWKLTQPVARGLRAASEGLGFDLPQPLATLAAKAHWELPDEAPAVRTSRSRLMELRSGGLRRRLSVARSFLFPSREFLRFTYGDRIAPLLYARRWGSMASRARAGSSARDNRPSVKRLPAIPTDFPARPMTQSARPVATIARIRPSVDLASVVTTKRPAHRATSDSATPTLPSRQERWRQARPRQPSADPPRPLVTTAEGGTPPHDLPPPPVPIPNDSEPSSRRHDDGRPTETGTGLAISGVAALIATAVGTRLGINFAGVILVPVAGILFAVAMARHIARIRPDEKWVGSWLVLGVVVKIAASYARYFTLVSSYGGNGDASGYDDFGRQFANAWMGNGVEPYLPDLRKTNFVRWFTGVVYYLFGQHMVAGFFLFGLLALVGSYLWYRATADSVPFLDKRLYLGLLMFAPSIAFWPSSIGKESLMQLGIGAMALATSFFLGRRLIRGLALGLSGGWLLWVVRPHLLALVTVAAGFAYFVGHVRPKNTTSKGVAVRTIGLVVVAFLVAFTVAQGMKFLGMKDLSLDSVDQTLSEQQDRTGQGGSSFDNGGDYLSPVNLPRGFVTVLLRPFPWEAGSPFGLLASLETAVLAGAIVVRFSSVRTSLSRARRTPFLLYCWVLTILYAATFSSFANFGILVRQRSLVLPALFVLIAVMPVHEDDAALEAHAVSAAVENRRD